MSVITKMRKQKAVYWERNNTITATGQLTYKAPVIVACRWDYKVEEFINTQNVVLKASSVVYPDRLMAEGDFLREITLTDVGEYSIDPKQDENAREILGFAKTPNFKNTETLFTAYL